MRQHLSVDGSRYSSEDVGINFFRNVLNPGIKNTSVYIGVIVAVSKHTGEGGLMQGICL
jgi:hypothetical protein